MFVWQEVQDVLDGLRLPGGLGAHKGPFGSTAGHYRKMTAVLLCCAPSCLMDSHLEHWFSKHSLSQPSVNHSLIKEKRGKIRGKVSWKTSITVVFELKD